MKRLRFPLDGIIVGAAMFAAMSAAWWLTPKALVANLPPLYQAIPTRFGDWREIQTAVAPVDPSGDRETERNTNSPYDDVLMRTYANPRGDVILLALAYGRNQRQEVKIHRPDLCYVAQGFRVLRRAAVVFPDQYDGSPPIAGERLLVQSPGRVEAVSYWIRIGVSYSESSWATRYYIFSQGLKRRALDGILVRVSQIVDVPEGASDQRYLLQEQFAADLVRAMDPAARSLLIVGSGA